MSDFNALESQVYVAHHRRAVTADDAAAPTVATYAVNPERRYATCRVFAEVDFSGDADATVDLEVYVCDPGHHAGGLLSTAELISTYAAAAFVTAVAVKQLALRELLEGSYAFDVPVNGGGIFVRINNLAGYAYTPAVSVHLLWMDALKG